MHTEQPIDKAALKVELDRVKKEAAKAKLKIAEKKRERQESNAEDAKPTSVG